MTEASEYRFSGIETDNPLWQFALRFWSLPGSEPACLSLQDKGWCVTEILAALWLATERKVYTGEPDRVRVWQQQNTRPLRRMRKAIKADEPELAAFRSQLARSELAAEQVALALVHDSYRETSATTGAPMAIMVRNLDRAVPDGLRQADIGTDEDVQRLIRLFRHYLADKGETDREVPPC